MFGDLSSRVTRANDPWPRARLAAPLPAPRPAAPRSPAAPRETEVGKGRTQLMALHGRPGGGLRGATRHPPCRGLPCRYSRAGAAAARASSGAVPANALPTVRDPMQPITPGGLRVEAAASAASRRRRQGAAEVGKEPVPSAGDAGVAQRGPARGHGQVGARGAPAGARRGARGPGCHLPPPRLRALFRAPCGSLSAAAAPPVPPPSPRCPPAPRSRLPDGGRAEIG